MNAAPPDLSEFDKKALLHAIDRQYEAEIDGAASRAKATAASATHEESRPENDKDTRSVEESYLARGQAQRVADLEHERGLLRTMAAPSVVDGRITVGSLVRLEDDDGERVVLMVPAGGGRRVDVGGVSVQLVTPQAPLGAALIGLGVDDEFKLILRGRSRDVAVVAIS